MSAGLPVGMMLIGRHWEDGTVLRAADAFQMSGRRNSELPANGDNDVQGSEQEARLLSDASLCRFSTLWRSGGPA